MSMNPPRKVIHDVIGTITSCGKRLTELEKINKIETKYGWETIYVIPLFALVGVNHRQPIMQMSKIIVYIYTTDEKSINLRLVI